MKQLRKFLNEWYSAAITLGFIIWALYELNIFAAMGWFVVLIYELSEKVTKWYIKELERDRDNWQELYKHIKP